MAKRTGGVSPLAYNVMRLNVSGLFRPLRFSRCYWSGLKKEKRRGEKKFENFYFKMI